MAGSSRIGGNRAAHAGGERKGSENLAREEPRMLTSESRVASCSETQQNRVRIATFSACSAFSIFFFPILLLQPVTFLVALWGVLGVVIAGATGMLVLSSTAKRQPITPELTEDLLRLLEASAARQFAKAFPSHVPGCPYCRSRRVRISDDDPEDLFCPSCRRYYLRSISLECWRAYFKLQGYAGIYGMERVMAYWKPDPHSIFQGRIPTILPHDAPEVLRAILADAARSGDHSESRTSHVPPAAELETRRRAALV